MIYFQKWSDDSFESKFLKHLEKNIKKSKLKLYIGFDYGFFLGINIYYCNDDAFICAANMYNSFLKQKQLVRLFTNSDISKDYDIIILLGYSNLRKERLRLLKNKNKILKALSFY